mmetsp:Transcript_4327/g.7486  ORF Transcript_4327/g.7486 Transcript_4327/m.7486 type:complete len:80 (+) Transcript_4327:243-482(+)
MDDSQTYSSPVESHQPHETHLGFPCGESPFSSVPHKDICIGGEYPKHMDQQTNTTKVVNYILIGLSCKIKSPKILHKYS